MVFPNAGVEVSPALLLLLGFMVGMLGGFFGVGVGFLATSGLLVLGAPPLFAVGTGFALIMGSSFINTLNHRRRRNVDYKLGLLILIGTIPALFLASKLNSYLEDSGSAGPVIRYLYMAALGIVGSLMLYDYIKARNRPGAQEDGASTGGIARRVRSLRVPPESIGFFGYLSIPTYVALPVSTIQRISVWVPIGIGAGIGFLSGLMGVGGGFILVPVMVFLLGLPSPVAAGTSLLQVFVAGSVGTLLYSLSNRVDLLMAVIMLLTASGGAQLGVAATRLVEGSRIRFLFGTTLISNAVAVALKQVSESSEIELLSDIASILLMSTAGAMCIIILAFMAAKSRTRGKVL